MSYRTGLGVLMRVAVVLAVVGAAALLGKATRTASKIGSSPSEDSAQPEPDAPAAAVELDGLVVDDYTHEDEPWAPELFAEFKVLPSRSDAFVGYRMLDFEGEYHTIRDGHRVSYAPDDPKLTVWFFGGSTMFGIGQRDDHTIPSVIARLAEQDGIPLRAVNFGVSGYENWRSLQQFQQALTSIGESPPDLAVFYEGINDWSLGTERMDLGDTRSGAITRFALSDDERDLVRSARDNVGPVPIGPARDELAIELSADQYQRGSELVDHLAKSFEVPVARFWQPSPFAKRPRPSDDELWERLEFNPEFLPRTAKQYGEVRIRSNVDTIDLTTVLDEIDRPIYFDGGHTNELGARIVGEAMYEHLYARLQALTASG